MSDDTARLKRAKDWVDTQSAWTSLRAAYLAGAREEAAISAAQIEMLEAELRAAEDGSGISNVAAQYESQLAAEREEIAKLQEACRLANPMVSGHAMQHLENGKQLARAATWRERPEVQRALAAKPTEPGGAR